MIRAVIFDCDGVLFDSRRANVAFYNAVLAGIGQPALDDDGERLANSASVRQLFQTLFIDAPDLLAAARAQSQRTDYGPFYSLMEPVPGLSSLLSRLKQDYRLGMATNRGMTLPGVIERFDLGRFFEVAVGVRDVPRAKPAPDMLEKCLDHFGLGPAEAVFVGDAGTDYEAAQAAGMHFVAVGDEVDAPRRVQGVQELPALLAEMSTA
jgi:phosphoglycolate phosphatase-like HAD superfamily hydrolase